MNREGAKVLSTEQVILHPSAFVLARVRLLITGHARPLITAALCLLLAGCGLIQVGVSNSPDWCPNKESKGCL